LVARGRFLKFPIQMGGAEVVRRRGTDPAHAPTHNNVGGYMRGKQMGLRKKGKDGAAAAQGTNTALGPLKPPHLPLPPSALKVPVGPTVWPKGLTRVSAHRGACNRA
jgi:hypothetical protein